jgi:hypothetical protein
MRTPRPEPEANDPALRVDYRELFAPTRNEPHLALLFAAALVLGLEALRGSRVVLTSPAIPALQALIATVAFILVWRQQDRLRLWPLLATGLAFQLAWISVHLANGVGSDGDSSSVYAGTGEALLDGHYPSSEYPAGAVLLFAVDALLAGGGGSDVRVSHALVMIPLNLVTALSVWMLRSRWSNWFAALVVLWPLNAFYWEFKFDPAPAAALAGGLVLATRGRWRWSAVVLGLGAALKWTPALAGVLLAIWLFAGGQRRRAASYLGLLALTFLLIHLPFLLVSPHAVLAAYEQQSGRGLTPESIFYIPLRTLDLASFPGQIWHEAIVPGWANPAATVIQLLTLLGIAFGAARVRRSLPAGVAIAGMGPVVFLLTNRVFSPQFFVLFVGAWAIAGSLLARSSIDQLGFGLLFLGGTLANVLVYPVIVTHWGVFSALLFVLSFAATAWVFVRALGQTRDKTPFPIVASATREPS